MNKGTTTPLRGDDGLRGGGLVEKGLLVSEIVLDGAGIKYLETLNSYQLRDVDSGTILQGEFKGSLTATVFPEMIRTDKKF